MFPESDLLPISGLQHLAFCARQWGLIHLEGVWAENRLTAQGRVLHERAHAADGEVEVREGIRIARGLRLRSLRLGLAGIADVVELHEQSAGPWRPFPVEYKRGRPKPDHPDAVQLCAQALCLEEMLSTDVPAGAIFYGQPRRRTEITFDPALRAETEALAARMQALHAMGRTPQAEYAKKCESCSLLNLCLPKLTGGARSANAYLRRQLARLDEEDP